MKPFKPNYRIFVSEEFAADFKRKVPQSIVLYSLWMTGIKKILSLSVFGEVKTKYIYIFFKFFFPLEKFEAALRHGAMTLFYYYFQQ